MIFFKDECCRFYFCIFEKNHIRAALKYNIYCIFFPLPRANVSKRIMRKDYHYRILKYLNNQDGNINIRPFINKIIATSSFSGAYLANKLRELKDKNFIWFDNVDCLQVKSNMFQPDIHPILARIEPDGVREYNTRRQLYQSFGISIISLICAIISVGISILALVLPMHLLHK